MAEGLLIVGVLAGVGGGKSTAARLLGEAAGGRVLDADRVVADLLEDPQVLAELEVAAGGTLRLADGRLDRAALAARIFAHREARRRVEAVLHPRVRARHWADLERIEREQPGCVVVLDVPLLLEGGLAEICDFLVFVAAADDLRAARACARHGWSREEWQRREAAQATLAAKRTRADAILHNEAGIEELRAQCADLASRLRDLPTRPLRVRWPAPEEAPPSQGTR